MAADLQVAEGIEVREDRTPDGRRGVDRDRFAARVVRDAKRREAQAGELVIEDATRLPATLGGPAPRLGALAVAGPVQDDPAAVGGATQEPEQGLDLESQAREPRRDRALGGVDRRARSQVDDTRHGPARVSRSVVLARQDSTERVGGGRLGALGEHDSGSAEGPDACDHAASSQTPAQAPTPEGNLGSPPSAGP